METDPEMNSRGQLTIEFMLIVVICIVYLNTVIMPAVDYGETTVNDVYNLSQTRMATQKIVDSLKSVSLQTDQSKQTFTINLPAGATITCTPSAGGGGFIHMEYKLQGEPAGACDPNTKICSHEELISGIACDNMHALNPTPLSGPLQTSLIVQKTGLKIELNR